MENFQEPCSSVNYSDRTSTILHAVFQTALQENEFVLTHIYIYTYIKHLEFMDKQFKNDSNTEGNRF